MVFRLISTELRWRLNSASMSFSSSMVARLCMQNCLTAPSIDKGHPSGICDSSSVSPQLSIIVPSIGISTVALKSSIARLLFQLSVKTRERRGSSFSQLGLEPNHTGLTAQSLFFLEESCRVKRSDTQTSSNFSNYFKRVLKLQKRSSSFSK